MTYSLDNARADGLLNRRLRKEMNLLRLPFFAALAAGGLLLILNGFPVSPDRMLPSAVIVPTWFGFFACLLLIATLPFGREFQYRTLALLLSQPSERARLWRDKVKASALAIGVVILALWMGGLALTLLPLPWQARSSAALGLGNLESSGDFNTFGVVAFAVTLLCAAPYWTLVTGSTIGGVAFTVTSQFLTFALVSFVCGKAGAPEGMGVVPGGIAYCAVFLWLGWRKFSTLELREGTFGEVSADEATAEHPSSWLGRLRRGWSLAAARATWLDRAFRCRPEGNLGNLFRKELRLQKPVYLLGGLFAVCWVVVLGLHLFQSDKGYENLFTALIALYVPLVLLLAGTISISEENLLGLADWQLVLPASARRQWAVKLAASSIAGAAMGWVLPTLLACFSGLVTGAGFSARWMSGDPAIFVMLLSGALFLIGFWAVTLVGNTVRAVLAALIGLVVLVCFISGGIWLAMQSNGWSRALCERIAFSLGWPPDLLYPPMAFIARWAPLVAVLVGVLAGLSQSLRVFRRLRPLPSARILYPAILALLAFLAGFICTDFEVSKSELGSTRRYEVDLAKAVAALPPSSLNAPDGQPRTLTVQELAATGKLSRLTQLWLQGCQLKLSRNTVDRRGGFESQPATLNIRFPPGRFCTEVYLPMPIPARRPE